MRLIILYSPHLSNYDLFKQEVLSTIERYKKFGFDIKNLEIVYVDFPHTKIVKDFIAEYNFNFYKYETTSFKITNSILLDLMTLAAEDESILLIIEDNYNKFFKIFNTAKKYNSFLNIAIVLFETNFDALVCCDQEMITIKSDKHFDYIYCDCCHTGLVLSQELVDEFIINTSNTIIKKRTNYLKGDLK